MLDIQRDLSLIEDLKRQIDTNDKRQEKLKLMIETSEAVGHQLMRESENLRLNKIALSQLIRSLQLQSTVLEKSETEVLCIERLVVGNGIAGTALYENFPDEDRKAIHNGVPRILVIADPKNPHQFIKHGESLMGQTSNLQTPASFSLSPKKISERTRDPEIDKMTNPYSYTRGIDFSLSIADAQEKLGMTTLPAELKKVEKREENHDWPEAASAYRFRVTLQIGQKEMQFYTQHIDLCCGLGATRKLSETQISPREATRLEKSGVLVYAQNTPHPKLKGKVVVFGGGAMSAAIAADLLLGKYEDEAELVKWVSRSSNDFEVTRETNRLNQDLLSGALPVQDKLSLGDVKSIEELSGGQVKITFSPPRVREGVKETGFSKHIHRFENEESIICDHVIVGIGAKNEMENIFQRFRFIPLYENDQTKTGISIGTATPEGDIVAWGAVGAGGGFGLSSQDREEFNASLTDYLKTLPFESKGSATVLRSVHAIFAMVNLLKKRNLFPEIKDKEIRLHLPSNINSVTEQELMGTVSQFLRKRHKEKLIDQPMQEQIQMQAKAIVDLILRVRSQPSGEGITTMKVFEGLLDEALIDELAFEYMPFNLAENLRRLMQESQLSQAETLDITEELTPANLEILKRELQAFTKLLSSTPTPQPEQARCELESKANPVILSEAQKRVNQDAPPSPSLQAGTKVSFSKKKER